MEHPELRNRLATLTRYFRQRLREIGLDVIDSPAPIVSFGLGTSKDMLAVKRQLFAQGINIYVSNYLGSGEHGIIRCAVFADHHKDDIDRLVDALAKCGS
jgi:7-keto-8-aminopelargonate synthetase-like enzyme